MSDSAPFRAMRLIGTTGNYFRVVPENEHMLTNGRMVEVTVQNVDGKLTELDGNQGDFLASKDLTRIVAEIRTLDAKRASLVAHILTIPGGVESLTEGGIEVPEAQTMHSPASRAKSNNDKQAAKRKTVADRSRSARTSKRADAKAQEAAKSPKLAAGENQTIAHVGVQVKPLESDEDI